MSFIHSKMLNLSQRAKEKLSTLLHLWAEKPIAV